MTLALRVSSLDKWGSELCAQIETEVWSARIRKKTLREWWFLRICQPSTEELTMVLSVKILLFTLWMEAWRLDLFCDKVVFVSGEKPAPWRSWVSAAGRQSQGEDSISLKIDCCYMMNQDDIPHINKAVGVATRLTKARKWNSRSGSSFDILESTAWIREVVVHSQKKRKGWFHQEHCQL